MLPIKLREQMGLIPGEVYSFATTEHGGHNQCKCTCGPVLSQVEEAKQILRENGIEI